MAPTKPSDHWPAPADAPSLSAALVSSRGVAAHADVAQLAALRAAREFFWIDLVGADDAARGGWLAALDLDAGDAAWLQRFGQAGRVSFDQRRLRASTWLSDGPRKGLTEIHVLGSQHCLITAWVGDPAALDAIRERLAETFAGRPISASASVAVLLQLILSTLHGAMSAVDAQLIAIEQQLGEAPASLDFAAMNAQTRRLQSIWSEVERYSQAVKCAMIGLDALPAVDARGAEALASYSEQVEDLESRLKERSQWGSEMARDYAAAMAHTQSLQISRLTMVSLVFLPITFITGFFGMNFPWMVSALRGASAFAALGLALPVLSVAATAFWLLAQRRKIVARAPRARTR